MPNTTEEDPLIHGVRIDAGGDDGGEIRFDYGNMHISVSVFARAPFSTSIPLEGNSPLTDTLVTSDTLEQNLIRLMAEATGEDDASWETASNEVLDVVLEAGKTIFAALASSLTPPNPLDLHTLLYPQTSYFRLQSAAEGEAVLVSIRPDESYSGGDMPNDQSLDIEGEDDLPRFSTKEVHVVDILTRGLGAVCRVVVNGTVEMFCKANQNGLSDESIRREITSLRGIAKSSSASSIRVPRLLGYAENPDDRRIAGFLREWISPGRPLSTIDISAISRELRQGWADQVRQTITHLHGIGIIWGDGKPSNIVIDEKDNAWLIDFGGGWTDGWVDSQLENTVAGDNQALEKIVKWLHSPEAGME